MEHAIYRMVQGIADMEALVQQAGYDSAQDFEDSLGVGLDNLLGVYLPDQYSPLATMERVEDGMFIPWEAVPAGVEAQEVQVLCFSHRIIEGKAHTMVTIDTVDAMVLMIGDSELAFIPFDTFETLNS